MSYQVILEILITNHFFLILRETSQDTDGFKKSISSLYEKSGLQAVFTDDIVKLINVANSEKDYDFIRVILVGCLR